MCLAVYVAIEYALPVRLVGGSRPSEGRLEVKASAVWSTICSRYFSTAAGSVACRQLGYYGVKSIVSGDSGFGPGTYTHLYIHTPVHTHVFM